METFTKKASGAALIAGFLVLTLMLLASFLLRQKDSSGTVGIQNIEATYHVLLTIKALGGSPAADHLYLPTVTLGKPADKKIPWGATIPTSSGDYLYTSFTPPGFLAPYMALRIFNAAPDTGNLARFNFALGAASSIILFIFLWQLLVFMGHSQWKSIGGALTGSAIGIFSREALQSHGLVYWSHCLYQVLLIASLWLVFKYLSTDPKQHRVRRHYSHSIVIMAFLGAWIEWTAYIFNFGLALLFWFGVQGVGRARGMSVRIALATIAAGILTVAHYALAAGLLPTLKAFAGRFLARNAASGNLVGLLQGYALSFGLFLLVLAGILIANYFSDSNRKERSHRNTVVAFVALAASLPLLENFLMLQHATQFSFDRLKLIFPAAILISIYFCEKSKRTKIILTAAIACSSLHGYKSYQDGLAPYAQWREIDARNNKLATMIAERTNLECAVLLSNISVRAYANLLFERGIHENKKLNESTSLMNSRAACAAIFLEGEEAYSKISRINNSIIYYPDLPLFRRATITYRDGSSVEIDPDRPSL